MITGCRPKVSYVVRVLMVLAITTVPVPGNSIQNAFQSTASAPQTVQSNGAGLSYQEMVKKAESGDTAVDFGGMRMKYAASKDYEPEAGSEETKAMYQNLQAKNYQGALDEANKLMKIQYVNIDAHMGASAAYTGLHNEAAAKLHHDIAASLLKSIKASGTGTSVDSPYVVIAVAEEYAFMRAMGYLPSRQSYLHKGKKSFDEMEMTDTKDNSKVTVYFDVTLSDQSMMKGLKK
jgi:hypothetical protein